LQSNLIKHLALLMICMWLYCYWPVRMVACLFGVTL